MIFTEKCIMVTFKSSLGTRTNPRLLMLFARHARSTYGNELMELESLTDLAFQWFGVSRRIMVMTATSVQLIQLD